MGDDESQLMWAIQTGDLDSENGVRHWIERGGFKATHKSAGYREATLIMTAADYGHAQLIEYLIKKGGMLATCVCDAAR